MNRKGPGTPGIALICTFLLATLALPAPSSGQWDPGRPDSHAPIGVMGDHRHEGGEVMLSYRYMYMPMEGSRVGTDPVADSEILDPNAYGFLVTPTRMPTHMHMLGVMWAPSDAVTLMGMGSFLSNSMDHVTRMGGTFTTESGGVGDTRVGALVGLADWGNQRLHANLFVSLPTGSIEEKGILPTSMGNEVQLPYPMQVGSGTWDVLPGITWLGQAGEASWGAQVAGTIRLGENDRGWTLGDRLHGTAWAARNLGSRWSASLRLNGGWWGDIEGMDPAPSVNPNVVPTARTDLRGGTQLDVGVGLNFYLKEASAFRIAAEALFPLYRDLHGPQLETDWTVVVGLQLVPIK